MQRLKDRLRAAWTSLRADRRKLAGVIVVAVLAVGGIGVAIAMLAGGSGQTAAASPSPSAAFEPSPSPSPTPIPSPKPPPSLEPTPQPEDLTGKDGRFTILLLGSDYRPAHPGNRTDVIMVVSIDPWTGQTAAVSIPRDTARFPLPGGGTYGPKVNGLYQHYIATDGRAKAGTEMKRTIGAALGVEIDYYAVVGFQGVRELVNAVGGVEVRLTKAVSDPHYWVTNTQQGVYFPAGVNKLNGERALIFARTRKGDNDYERARRQQLLVAAAVAKVREKGVAIVPDLVRIGVRWVKTDLPLAKTLAIFELASKADLDTKQRVVFGPKQWANGIPGSSSNQLKLDVVRKQIDEWMPAVTPPPSPSPSPTLSPSASPSASPLASVGPTSSP